MNKEVFFQRYAYPEVLLNDIPVDKELGMIITIPSYKEPDIIPTLESINGCEKPDCSVEILILVNQSSADPPEVERINQKTFSDAGAWIRSTTTHYPFHIVFKKDLPPGHAGVGMARKIIMDEAARRLKRAGNDYGIITGLDADSLVEADYMTSIESSFRTQYLKGASIYFEHPVDRVKNDHMRQGIISYELHLRYYILAQRYSGFPYSFHAVGSSMAVRSDIYRKQGGMNRRKAGEDFYFLHKIIPLGQYAEVNTTRVIPSSRISERVPFGTGRAMWEWSRGENRFFQTYHPQTFEDLRSLIQSVGTWFNLDERAIRQSIQGLPVTIKAFLGEEQLYEKVILFRRHSSGFRTFYDKFFNWFNGLKLLRYVHFARDHSFGTVSVSEAYRWLSDKYSLAFEESMSVRDMLDEVRHHDRNYAFSYRKS